MCNAHCTYMLEYVRAVRTSSLVRVHISAVNSGNFPDSSKGKKKSAIRWLFCRLKFCLASCSFFPHTYCWIHTRPQSTTQGMALEPGRDSDIQSDDSSRASQWQQNGQRGPSGGHGLYYHHHGPGLFGLSVEEIKVIRDCSNEANWKYALPATVIGAGLAYAATRGRATANQPLRSWSSFLLVTSAAVLGNLTGRMAYTAFGSCQDKMAALPADSEIGETARKLNAAGVRLPPYMIVAGAESGPWSAWGDVWHGNTWGGHRGYGSGYRYGPYGQGQQNSSSDWQQQQNAGNWQQRQSDLRNSEARSK